MRAPVRSRFALVLVVIVLSGCTGSTPTPSTSPSGPVTLVTPPTPPTHANTSVEVVSIDGRWPIPQDAASAMVASAFGAQPGALLVGEASFGAAAGPVAAFDARAIELLGGLRDAATNATLAPPAAGEVLVTRALRDAANLTVGANVTLVTYAWPPSHVNAAFEMERVRPCDPQLAAPICTMPTSPQGEAVLAVRVPDGSSDLAFHPDVVELQSTDFPAIWNGTFAAPDGTQTTFTTGAYDRANVTPPAVLSGPTQPGTWSIRFTLDVHGKRAPGAIAGFVTYRTLGFSAFDIDLLRVPDAGEQTRLLLQNATRSEATLRVAGIVSPEGAPALAGAVAVLSPSDARALLRLGAGNVTALVAPAAPGADAALDNATQLADAPALRTLHARAALAMPPPAAAGGDRALVWAPADLADAGGRALTIELLPALGAEDRVKDHRVAQPASLLSLPVDDLHPPWSLVPKALWPNVTAAMGGMASGPHLLLLSDDYARLAGLDPGNATYAKVEIDAALGARAVFGMGAVAGGPARSIWASAALVGASGAPGGARLVVARDDVDATLAAVPGAALWLGP